MNDSPELVLDGAEPICQQIEEQIRRLVLSGELMPGEELPTIRAVAVGLAVNPRAVERAYDQLEQAGLLSRADGSGPRLAEPAPGTADADLKQLCERFLRETAERGYSFAAVRRALGACQAEEISS
jgi:GntR family transcriptional regulator